MRSYGKKLKIIIIVKIDLKRINAKRVPNCHKKTNPKTSTFK
jgi:hypothetical protein